MKAVLALTDFSPRAEDAAKFAMRLAVENKASLILCHAMEIAAQYTSANADYRWPVADYLTLKQECIQDLKELGKKLKEDLAPDDFKPSICCIADVDSLTELSARVIKDKSIDLVVMGAHKSQGWARLLFGSHTHALLDKVDCPVLLVPENLSYKGLSNIAYATDLTFNNALVLQYLLKIAKPFGAKISVSHVSPLNFPITESEHGVENQGDEESGADAEIVYQTIKGENVTSSLLGIAGSGWVDMLAVVHKRYDFFESLFHASISKQLAGIAKVPLLILPYSFSLNADLTNQELDNFCYKTGGNRMPQN